MCDGVKLSKAGVHARDDNMQLQANGSASSSPADNPLTCPGRVGKCDELFQLRDEFLNLAACIAAKYGRNVTCVVNVLMKYACERCVIEVLKKSLHNSGFDMVWRNLHDYASLLLIEKLKNDLEAGDFAVAIANECDNPTGRYDILIVNGRNVQVFNGDGGICVELKVGLNIPISQIEKYLWSNTTLILVRFATGDIIKLSAKDSASLLKFALKERIRKAERILNGRAVLVPGKDCWHCPLQDCRFNRRKDVNGITKPHNLEELLRAVMGMVPTTVEKAAKTILEELTATMGSHGA